MLAILTGWTPHGASVETEEASFLRVQVVKEIEIDSEATGEVVAREETGRRAEIRAPFVVPADRPSVEISIPLPTEGSWWFSAIGGGLYSKPKAAAFPLESRLVSLGIRPLVKLKGRLVSPSLGSLDGREALLRWRAPGSADPWERVKTVVSAGQIEADVPAGTWDLSVKVTGCASWRRENALIPPGVTMDLGRVSAVPGASLVGRVSAAGREAVAALKGTRVTLSPAGEIPGASSQKGGISLSKEVGLSALGEFQVTGLVAGRYNLRIRAVGFAREDRTVDLVPDMEVELRDPISLAKPGTLQLDLNPPFDARGSTWTVELREKGEAGWPLGSGLTSRASAGTALFEDVRLNGEYVAVVRAANGDAWRVESVRIEASRMRLSLQLDSTAVLGRVTVGDEPVSAELIFGGKKAAPSVQVKSGEDGEFRVELPRAGPWRVAVSSQAPRVSRVVSVEIPEPRDGLPSRIELALPLTRLKVRVLDGKGAPVGRDCIVRLESVVTHETLAERVGMGEVEPVGLEVGEWIVYAESAGAVSDRKTVIVEKGARQEVTLTLAEKQLVKGVVVSILGVAVPYARLQPLRWDSRADTFPAAITADALGRFQFQVPPEVLRVGLLVIAPGYPMTTALIPVGGSDDVAVQVPQEGGRVQFSFDSRDYPFPRMPYVTDGSLTLLATLLRSSPEVKVSLRDGRTNVEIPSFRAGPFGVCQSAVIGASDSESVGQDCALGNVVPGREVFLDLERRRP